MHQPYYKDPLTNEASMPWVRLHGIKDYLDMCEILEDYPRIHQTFNYAPSLIDQIKDYEKGTVKDKFLELSMKEASSLTKMEKAFILTNFFMANWDNMVKAFPRYQDLLIKRGRHISHGELEFAINRFSLDEMRDLQVLFNLAWFDPSFRGKIPELKALSLKGSHFSEEDKKYILYTQFAILKRIIPKHMELQRVGQIEVSISPYYHPILPLLCDKHIARVALPHLPMPKERFSYPEDAKWHIDEAVKLYEETFGLKPSGMWPSEGSVSEEMIPLVIDAGLKWIATDEEILFRSIGKPRKGEFLYKPYSLTRNGKGLSIIFRDHGLSDLIGFSYSRMHHKDAVSDFMKHLRNIQNDLSGSSEAHLVSVVLDGENAWEYYQNDGRDFLIALYEELSSQNDIRCVTVKEFLNDHPPQEEAGNLHPGSWINANFAVWIGHKEKNLSWDYLAKARNALVQFVGSNPDKASSFEVLEAWNEIHIAEGSDWNWWYGDDHSSSCDDEFDRLYRMHLMNIYTILKLDVPEYLKIPIRSREPRPKKEPSGFITPKIDGLDTNYYEWLNAGYFEPAKLGGAMHQAQFFIEKLYYGFGADDLYLRLDLSSEAKAPDLLQKLKVVIDIPSHNRRLEVSLGEELKKLEGDVEVAFDRVFEIRLNFKTFLNALKGEEMTLRVMLEKEKLTIEGIPREGMIRFKVPSEDFESWFWYI